MGTLYASRKDYTLNCSKSCLDGVRTTGMSLNISDFER